ncbi:hypothetical protein GZ22_13220 [Terribacillus saccharophilus]|uniref:DNA (cytosine-5-)-methyltransferase n=1 Tax=Terribacillus saccharophilus TaxID=361277 RepID=A0A075LMB6_9BACI|nr:DNA cytosine methyltransferase [Terribacillus goriensis]AIF67499.1 hypothetical protein GZ22_13220 [Terribacillus goriensis]
MTKQYQILDLFSGAGGLSNGFEQTGQFSVIGAIEVNIAAQKTYIKNHDGKDHLILKSLDSGTSDITKINFKDLQLDSNKTVVIGGPPCQGFSNANRQKNYLISGNNQLVKEYARAIRDVRPVAFLMENVKSINSSVHKFFVTNFNNNDEDDFSSKRHLDSISMDDQHPLYEKDYIDLLISQSEILRIIVKEFKRLSDVPEPIIDDTLLITRLRALERRMKSRDQVRLKEKEQKEVKQILTLINIYNNRNAYFQPIISEAIEALSILLSGSASIKLIQKKMQDFIDLNRFLIRCQELKDENIDCKNLILTEESLFKVRVEVYSYNIVKYLKRLFTHYGYILDSGVLDASYFGVPQRRRRFMMMGVHRKCKSDSAVELPKPADNRIFTVRDAIEDLEDIEPQQEINTYKKHIYNKEFQSELIRYYREQIEGNLLSDHINTKSSELIQLRYKQIREIGGKNFHSLPENMKASYRDASRTQNTVYLRLNYDEPSPTVINVRKSMWQHPTKARALSIREAARLQSFQDSFVFEGRKDERYQQVGNAVPPKLAKAIAIKMLDYLPSTE